jgi:hypothetical protein
MKSVFDKTATTEWAVSRTGNVFRRTLGGEWVKKAATIHKKRGYVYVRTTNGNYQLHRLVATAFIPNKSSKPCVNHIDGNKLNNYVANLEWATHQENTRHAIDMGLIKPMKKNEGNMKYSNEQCWDVLERVESGLTYIKAGEIYGMPYSTVTHLVRGSRRMV